MFIYVACEIYLRVPTMPYMVTAIHKIDPAIASVPNMSATMAVVFAFSIESSENSLAM